MFSRTPSELACQQVELLGDLNKILQIKQFEQCLMHRKGIISIRYFIITITHEALNSNIINMFTTVSETPPHPSFCRQFLPKGSNYQDQIRHHIWEGRRVISHWNEMEVNCPIGERHFLEIFLWGKQRWFDWGGRRGMLEDRGEDRDGSWGRDKGLWHHIGIWEAH